MQQGAGLLYHWGALAERILWECCRQATVAGHNTGMKDLLAYIFNRGIDIQNLNQVIQNRHVLSNGYAIVITAGSGSGIVWRILLSEPKPEGVGLMMVVIPVPGRVPVQVEPPARGMGPTEWFRTLSDPGGRR